MAMRGVSLARPRVILEPVHQHGAHAGLARGVEFLDHVRQEQHVASGQADRFDDAAVAVGFALAAALGVEPAREQPRQVAGIAVAENRRCAGTLPEEYT